MTETLVKLLEYIENKSNEIDRMNVSKTQALTIRDNLILTLKLSDTELRIANSNERVNFDKDPVYDRIVNGGFTARDTSVYHERDGRKNYPWYFWEVLKKYKHMLRNRSMDARLYKNLKRCSISSIVDNAFEMFIKDIKRDAKYFGHTLENYRSKAEGYRI